ncbi:hypothetical protein FB451DRAFT_1535236 [Mycena latifolia]|nr:hypothetical protein FB451DRAFT_1535236 [Mycena latifolia]
MSSFPTEVWMRVFSFAKDRETLKALDMTSYQFHALAREELNRNMTWDTNDVEARLADWRIHPRRRRIEELDMGLVAYSDQAALNSIVTLQSFPNLGALTLRGGRVTPQIHAALAQLPKLRRLRLQNCALQTVPRATPPPTAPYALRDLVLHDVLITDTAQQPLDYLDGVTLRAHGVALLPFVLLNTIEALTISSDTSAALVVRQAHALLPHARSIQRLDVLSPPAHNTHDAPQIRSAFVYALPAPLPALTSFRGPRCLAAWLLPRAAHIAKVALTDELTTPLALDLLAALHPGTVCDIELVLTFWDAEVLCEIAHRFLACRRIKIVHRYSGPSDEFLCNVGSRHLTRMPALHTLLIHARPEDAVDKTPQREHYGISLKCDEAYLEEWRKWKADGAAGLRTVAPPPDEAKSREHFAVWRKWTPSLEVVDVGERRWTREWRGTKWTQNEAAI